MSEKVLELQYFVIKLNKVYNAEKIRLALLDCKEEVIHGQDLAKLILNSEIDGQ